jgi:hypothetical protein
MLLFGVVTSMFTFFLCARHFLCFFVRRRFVTVATIFDRVVNVTANMVVVASAGAAAAVTA